MENTALTPEKLARKLSAMQVRLLKAAVKGAEPILHGRSEHGGAVSSAWALRKKGLIVPQGGLDVATDLGRQVHAVLFPPAANR